MPRNRKQRSEVSQEVIDTATLEHSLPSPLEIAREERDSYWNGLLEDFNQLRQSIATVEFWPLLQAIPPALWEKRLIVYVYRTAPKVKNQAGEKAYIEKIAHAFDEEYIKANHGGGSYLCYLNVDSEENLKQISFTIDGPPKFMPGQTLVDAQGNPIPQPAAEKTSDVSDAIRATTDANRAGMEIMQKGTEAAIEMQQKIFEKAAGLSNNGREDKLLEILLTKAFDKAPAADPMTTALTMMDKLETIISRRMGDANPKTEGAPISEQLSIVHELSGGKTLGELISGGSTKKTGTEDLIAIGLQAAAQLVEKLPLIIQQIGVNRENEFRRQLYIAQTRGNALPPAATAAPGVTGVTNAPGATAPGGPRVAAAPAAPFVPAEFPTAPAGDNVVPISDGAAMDLGAQINTICKLIRQKFEAGYTGSAVAQTIDVLFPDIFASIHPTILNDADMTKFVMSMPDLAQLTQVPEWAEFRADFVQFVREEFAEDLAPGDGPAKPMAPAATA